MVAVVRYHSLSRMATRCCGLVRMVARLYYLAWMVARCRSRKTTRRCGLALTVVRLC